MACVTAPMFFAPFPLLFTWLAGLLSVALLGAGVYLIWAWYVGVVVGTTYLMLGLVMTAWALLGRWVVLAFHPSGRDEPRSVRADSEIRLPRPDGSTLDVRRTLWATTGAGNRPDAWCWRKPHVVVLPDWRPVGAVADPGVGYARPRPLRQAAPG